MRRRGQAILDAIAAGREAPPIPREPARERSEPGDAPLIALAEALLRARALEAGLAYELIASRSELELIVGAARRGEPEPDVRTLSGWRARARRRRPARPAPRAQRDRRRAAAPAGAQRRAASCDESEAPTSSITDIAGAWSNIARDSASVIGRGRWIEPRSTPRRSPEAVA